MSPGGGEGGAGAEGARAGGAGEIGRAFENDRVHQVGVVMLVSDIFKECPKETNTRL